ncbi:MAG TPA: cysteine synthase A [Wenzhouxiangella sp.]|nr:cysteine synthase A [Wenzhouxiangella sp.]
MIYQSMTDTIGKTPVIRLQRTGPDHVDIYVKPEAYNPAGSVKDRLALAIILDAEQSGALKPGQTVVEATSGNTGVALAAICAARGYPFVAVMTETFSIERRKLIKAYGGKLVLTPAEIRGVGMVKKARELAEKHGWFLASQFRNQANPAYHRQTTAAEVMADFAGRRLDYFVSGWGTGGTLTGVGEVLKTGRPDVQIIGAEPASASLLGGQPFEPHKIQGWTPDFLPEVLNGEVVDRLVTVGDEEARDTTLALARSEGIFAGLSSGATLAAALKVAKDAPRGSVLLAMLPDTGERYLSTFLFDDISVESDQIE